MSARYPFYLCDVFTDVRFAGNPLAVLPDAQGLTDLQMQQIAREFNFSETTFVLPAEAGHTRRVRIFTPTIELPFAGHPNIGTAYVRGDSDNDLRARVMIADDGYEDPATGSANCALAAMLAQLDSVQDGELGWRITQGVEMGRPSTLYTSAEKKGGQVVSARIAGACVLVANGTLDLD